MKQSAGGFFMQCREAVFAEDVLIYVVDNYRGEGYVREVYNPDCYIRLDDRQAIIYQQVQNVNGEAIQKYGFSDKLISIKIHSGVSISSS